MTLRLVDVSRWQVERADPLDLARAQTAGYHLANVALTGGRGYVSGAWAKTYIDRARALGMGVMTYHWLDGRTPGGVQAASTIARLRDLFGSGLGGFAHQVDVEETGAQGITQPGWAHVAEYVDAMQQALGRHVVIYSGDWWWGPRGWPGADLTPYLMGQPNDGKASTYPGDSSPKWAAGYGGWVDLSILQWGVQPLPGTGDCSLSALRDHEVWVDISGGDGVVATSQNGWAVDQTGSMQDRSAVEGATFPNGVRRGDVATVLFHLAAEFHRTVEPLRPGWCWGWFVKSIERSMAGAGGPAADLTVPPDGVAVCVGDPPDPDPGRRAGGDPRGDASTSNHASGTAIDLNAPNHPIGKRDTFTAKQVTAIRKILTYLEGVVRWGGDYVTRADDMHFEIVGSVSAVARVADKIRKGTTMTPAELLAALKNKDVRTELAKIVLNTDGIIPAPGSPQPGVNEDGTPVNTHWALASYIYYGYRRADAALEAATVTRTYSAQGRDAAQALAAPVTALLSYAQAAADRPAPTSEEIADALLDGLTRLPEELTAQALVAVLGDRAGRIADLIHALAAAGGTEPHTGS